MIRLIKFTMNDKNNLIFRYGPVKENENFADTGSLLKTAIVINLTGRYIKSVTHDAMKSLPVLSNGKLHNRGNISKIAGKINLLEALKM